MIRGATKLSFTCCSATATAKTCSASHQSINATTTATAAIPNVAPIKGIISINPIKIANRRKNGTRKVQNATVRVTAINSPNNNCPETNRWRLRFNAAVKPARIWREKILVIMPQTFSPSMSI